MTLSPLHENDSNDVGSQPHSVAILTHDLMDFMDASYNLGGTHESNLGANVIRFLLILLILK